MFFPVDVINLVLYFVQQLGVMFGVGAATILLIAYLVSTRDKVVDQKEDQFGHTVHKVLVFGLTLIVSSGATITALHLFMGASGIVFAPAYLFKWLLIAFILAGEVLRNKHIFAEARWAGLIGAHWYALFVVHALAPVALWADLIVLYVIWVAGFTLCVSAVARAMRIDTAVQLEPQKKVAVPPPQPKKAPPTVAMPRMVAPTPVPKPAPQPVVAAVLVPAKPVVVAAPPAPIKPVVPPVPHKPVVVPHITSAGEPPPLPKKPPQAPLKPFDGTVVPQVEEHFGLPAVRVMPKTPEELARHYANNTLQLAQ